MTAAEAERALGIDKSRTRFTVDGEPVFLLGMSLYGALGAQVESVERDLARLRGLGFNWVRVWATWAAFGNDVSAVSPDGAAREPFMSRLVALCGSARARGMVVDVTLSRGNGVVGPGLVPDMDSHGRIVETLTRRLAEFRNVYFDLANERNIRDRRHVPLDEVKALVETVKRLDPERLVTASHAGDIPREELSAYLEAGVDFIAPHRPRNAGSPAETEGTTREYLDALRELGRPVPVHCQEPFRRGFAKDWEPGAEDFLADLRGAVEGGAAGWCLHNGDDRRAPDGRPRRSFDMREREGGLFDQLDEEEKEVASRASAFAAGSGGGGVLAAAGAARAVVGPNVAAAVLGLVKRPPKAHLLDRCFYKNDPRAEGRTLVVVYEAPAPESGLVAQVVRLLKGAKLTPFTMDEVIPSAKEGRPVRVAVPEEEAERARWLVAQWKAGVLGNEDGFLDDRYCGNNPEAKGKELRVVFSARAEEGERIAQVIHLLLAGKLSPFTLDELVPSGAAGKPVRVAVPAAEERRARRLLHRWESERAEGELDARKAAATLGAGLACYPVAAVIARFVTGSWSEVPWGPLAVVLAMATVALTLIVAGSSEGPGKGERAREDAP